MRRNSDPVKEQYQIENQCCGWNNVFDYCSHQAIFDIVFQAIKYHELGEFVDSVDDLDYYSYNSELDSDNYAPFYSYLINQKDGIRNLLNSGFLFESQKPVSTMTVDDSDYYNDVYTENTFDLGFDI